MHKTRYSYGLWGTLVLLALVVVGGCAKTTVVAEKPAAESELKAGFEEEAISPETARKGRSRRQVTDRALAYGPEGIAFESEDVYFDYDQYILTPEGQARLKKKAAFLRRHPEVQVTIEGHCDERGSSDYNLGLGQKRADSARTYLIYLGIGGDRLATVSYGEEQPLDPGHDEAAWAKNRRAHLVIGGLKD